MFRTTLYRISLALVLAAVLVPQSSWAGTIRGTRPHAVSMSLYSQAWGHLVSLWGRVGSVIDPNGITFAPTSSKPTDTIPHDLRP
jgi:hypothetical protein